jgi:phage anti-repressor protein
MSAQALIPVIVDERINGGAQLVDGRALHRFLEVDARFNDWIARRLADYDFCEGEDFYSVLSKKGKGRPSMEYQLTLDMAKELSMIERNDKGKQARRYFIECEKRLHKVAPSDAMTIMAQTIGTDGFHMLAAVVKGKVSALPAALQRRATAKIWSQAHAAFGVRSAADIPAEQLDAARNFIAAYAILEGEYIKANRTDGIHLNRFETHHLYVLMSAFSAMRGKRDGMLAAARALSSKPLMAIFDQIQHGGGSFAELDKRGDEIYEAYRSFGCEGGYRSMGTAA